MPHPKPYHGHGKPHSRPSVLAEICGIRDWLSWTFDLSGRIWQTSSGCMPTSENRSLWRCHQLGIGDMDLTCHVPGFFLNRKTRWIDTTRWWPICINLKGWCQERQRLLTCSQHVSVRESGTNLQMLGSTGDLSCWCIPNLGTPQTLQNGLVGSTVLV